MHHSADVTAATPSVQDAPLHTACELHALLRDMHSVKAWPVRDHLD